MGNAGYQVSYIRVGCSDLQRAREFYGEILDLQLIVEDVREGYLLFDVGGIKLIIETPSSIDGELPLGRFLGISLRVKDIHEVYKTLTKEGVKFIRPPAKQFWGGFLAEIADPDGNIWTLIE